MFVGIAIGMLLSLITYSIVRRRRDYASVMQVKADRYEVTVLPDSVGAPGAGARRHADPAPRAVRDRGRAAAVRERVEEPPRYGERVTPSVRRCRRCARGPRVRCRPNGRAPPAPRPRARGRPQGDEGPQPEGDEQPGDGSSR
jgi:hypothetical protein